MKKILYFVYLVASFLLFFSCEKSLDLRPETTYSVTTFLKTADQFKLFANQFYYYLPTCGNRQDRDIYSDIVADRTTNTISNGSYSATPTSDLWDNSYIAIRNTTYLIQKGDEVSSDLKDGVKVYIGEAKFFRAFSYFNLLRDFSGVPIINKVLNLDDAALLYGPRNSREEVFDYIMNDLDDAINVLPVESNISSGDKGRVSKGAALALKAHVALFEGTWRKFRGIDGNALLDKAIDASGQIIQSGEYSLFDRRDVLGDGSYKYFFILDKVKSNVAGLTKADQNEYILANRFDATFRGNYEPGSEVMPDPTKKFADMFLCTDGLSIDKSPLFQGKLTVTSEYNNRDLRMKNIFSILGTPYWECDPRERARDWNNPFAGGMPGGIFITFGQTTITGYQDLKFIPEIVNSSKDNPVFRYAEVLLVNAEALFERNGSITDGQLDLTINKLRGRAGVANLSNALVSSNNLDMRTEIRRERTIELFMEGQRFDDLRRWKTAETEMPQALKGVLWSGTQFQTDPRWSGAVYPLDNDGYIIVEDASKRTFEAKHYLFPLPTRQILLNPKLEQNPGW